MTGEVAADKPLLRAVLSIGSNIGDRMAHLRSVLDAFAGPADGSVAGSLRSHADARMPTGAHMLAGARIVAASKVYRTPPWGGVEQQDFLNAILIVEAPCSALELLHFGQELEQDAARVREIHWGPRTLDVDIITASVAGMPIVSSTSELILPHPHAHDRAFVLVPWLDADPSATLAGRSVQQLIAELAPAEVAGVQPSGHSWQQTVEDLADPAPEGGK